MQNILTFVFCLVLLQIGSAQEKLNGRQAPVTMDAPAKPGTYQFVFKDRAAEEAIALSDLELIQLESLRDEASVKYIKYSEKTIIKLLPKQVVNNPSYTPSTEKIYIVEEPDFYNYRKLNLVSLY